MFITPPSKEHNDKATVLQKWKVLPICSFLKKVKPIDETKIKLAGLNEKGFV